jgi:hypothetical protein
MAHKCIFRDQGRITRRECREVISIHYTVPNVLLKAEIKNKMSLDIVK